MYRGAHVEKERIVSLYQWPQEWGFLVDFYSKVGHGLRVSRLYACAAAL